MHWIELRRTIRWHSESRVCKIWKLRIWSSSWSRGRNLSIKSSRSLKIWARSTKRKMPCSKRWTYWIWNWRKRTRSSLKSTRRNSDAMTVSKLRSTFSESSSSSERRAVSDAMAHTAGATIRGAGTMTWIAHPATRSTCRKVRVSAWKRTSRRNSRLNSLSKVKGTRTLTHSRVSSTISKKAWIAPIRFEMK